MFYRVLFTVLGFLVFKLPGAILGFLFGFWLDQQKARKRAVQREAIETLKGFQSGNVSQSHPVFFETVFLTLGRLCKADGQVSPEEIQGVERLMGLLNLSPAKRQEAIAFFNRGKEVDQFGFDQQVQAFRRAFSNNAILVQIFFQVLLDVAYADGDYVEAERKVLLEVLAGLGMPVSELEKIERRYQRQRAFFEHFRHTAEQMFGGGFQHQQQGYHQSTQAPPVRDEFEEACDVLDVSPSDDLPTIKKAYRRQMSQHHPDKLVSKGLPPEMIEIAKQKTQEIQAAWDVIQRYKSS